MKLYNRKEIGAILKKAAENSSADGLDSPLGLSIEELQQLASEAGIDPDQIAKAIAEVDRESEKSTWTFWGGPFSFSSQVAVDGEITIRQWEEMLIAIRDFFHSKGEVDTRESVFEWSSPRGTSNSAQVTALKDHGKTKISVGWHGPLTAVPFYLPVPVAAIAFMVFASANLELSAVPGISLTLLVSGLTFLAGRWALRRHLDLGFSKLRQMMAGLETIADQRDVASETVSDQTGASAITSATQDPVIQVHDVDADVESDLEPERRDRTRV